MAPVPTQAPSKMSRWLLLQLRAKWSGSSSKILPTNGEILHSSMRGLRIRSRASPNMLTGWPIGSQTWRTHMYGREFAHWMPSSGVPRNEHSGYTLTTEHAGGRQAARRAKIWRESLNSGDGLVASMHRSDREGKIAEAPDPQKDPGSRECAR